MQQIIALPASGHPLIVLPMVEIMHPQFAANLRSAMDRRGLSVTDIARHLGVTYEMARRYTLGTAKPRTRKLAELASLLGISPATLEYGDPLAYTEPTTQSSFNYKQTEHLEQPNHCVVNEAQAAYLTTPTKPHDIRRTNLLKLIDERFEGNRGRFADTVGRKRPLIYRLFSDVEGSRRDIGEELARDIEHKLGLKPGWLDLDGAATAEPVSGAYAVNIPPALAPLVQDLCRAFNSKSLTPAVVSSFRNMVQALNAQTQDIATSAEADAKTIKLGKKLSAKAINIPPAPSDTDKTSDLDSN